ncbi:MAG: 4-(cytidine 5'-diphospho)-2-C-methyl-D-erythritol kinase [Thermoleophilia bacterium]|nr:4-(cytidine 5'-diphospho)-2-C-methyl-D-erythritol kinase [Thermoleophilia bacterium]
MRADGYHPVRSLMVALEGPADRVHVARAPARRVECPGIDGAENLAWRALDALEAEVGHALPPLAVRIEKHLPAQAGVGGGSSDAAATLIGADRLLGLDLGPERLERAAAAVGSDVAFFVRGGAQWASGRGEVLTAASAPPFAALIAVPGRGLSTAAVYRAFDRLPAPPPDDGAPPPPTVRGLGTWCRNDLWPAALALDPALGAVARALRALGARPALLCGSGSAVAGLFADPDRAAWAGASPALAHLGVLTGTFAPVA